MTLTESIPTGRRHAFTLILVAVALTFLIGCGSCKTIKTTKTVRSGETRADTSITVKTSDQTSRIRTIKDSAIGLAPKEISFLLPTNASKDTQATNQHLRLHVYHDSKGIQHIDCSADSLTLVIARMIQDSIYQSHVNDSIYVSRQKDYFSERTENAVTKTTAWPSILIWMAVAITAIVMWELFTLLYKRTKP